MSDSRRGQPSSLDLVARIRTGDKDAFDALFREYFKPLRRYAITIVKCPTTAEDIVQTVFLRIWTGRETWALRTSVKAYLYSAVHHQAIQLLRQARVRDRHVMAVLSGDPEIEASEPESWPDSQVTVQELSELLQAALEKLPPRTRQAFELRRFQQLSYEEIATAMGISSSTVGVLIGRALVVLRKTLLPHLALWILVAL